MIEITFLSVIDILACATAFMLGLLFVSNKTRNKKANLFLGLFLISLSIEILEVLIRNNYDSDFWFLQTRFFTIVFLFFYVVFTINSRRLQWYWWLFTPGVVLNMVFYFGMPHEVLSFFEYVFNILLLVFILMLLRRNQEKVNHFYSDIEYKTLSWIKTIVFVYLGFYFLWIIEDLIGLGSEQLVLYFATTSTVLTFLMIYWIGFNGFSQNEIFREILFTNDDPKKLDNTAKPERSLSKEDIISFQNINTSILESKLYTNPQLTLRSLALMLDIKEKELSKIINTGGNNNFYSYINKFRVEEFKFLLSTPKASQLSILGLAQEAGFSSKSTFYSTFKRMEGITPKEYKSSINSPNGSSRTNGN